MKPLLPTLKEKKRYLVYSLASEKPIRSDGAVVEHIAKTLGVFDGARAGVMSVRYDATKQIGILRMTHTSVDIIKASLLTLREINATKVRLATIGVSGILAKTTRFEV